MIAGGRGALARWQGWAGLAIAGVALIAGLITIRGDEDPADARGRRGQPRRAYDYAPPARPALDLADVPIVLDVPDLADPAPAPTALAVEVTATALRLDGVDVTVSELSDRARAGAAAAAIEATITSSADVPYARIVEVMDALRAAGVEKIAFSAAP